MTEVRLRHEIETDEDTYWEKCVFNDEYNQKLFLEYLKFPGYRILEVKDDGKKITKKAVTDPPLGVMPGPVKKVIGDRLSYTEEGTFDRATKRYEFKVTPSSMPDKTTVTGVLRTEKLGDKRVLRIVEVSVEVKVFAIGGMIEERIAGDLRKSYEASAVFTNEWVKEKGL